MPYGPLNTCAIRGPTPDHWAVVVAQELVIGLPEVVGHISEFKAIQNTTVNFIVMTLVIKCLIFVPPPIILANDAHPLGFLHHHFYHFRRCYCLHQQDDQHYLSGGGIGNRLI